MTGDCVEPAPTAGRGTADELAGEMIKEIFRSAEGIAELHACLTSSRGGNFRLHLLQALEAPLEEAAIELLRVKSGVNEYHRHLNRLRELGLVQLREADGKRLYLRTDLGEKAINALRELERNVGTDAAEAIYAASLGPNSIRLLLRVYGDKREPDWRELQVRYRPEEIGRLSLFLPRVIEGISAIDKLSSAGLLVYEDDNHVYMQPTRARGVYQYLQQLCEVIAANREHSSTDHPR